jgi:hypothetical protein
MEKKQGAIGPMKNTYVFMQLSFSDALRILKPLLIFTNASVEYKTVNEALLVSWISNATLDAKSTSTPQSQPAQQLRVEITYYRNEYVLNVYEQKVEIKDAAATNKSPDSPNVFKAIEDAILEKHEVKIPLYTLKQMRDNAKPQGFYKFVKTNQDKNVELTLSDEETSYFTILNYGTTQSATFIQEEKEVIKTFHENDISSKYKDFLQKDGVLKLLSMLYASLFLHNITRFKAEFDREGWDYISDYGSRKSEALHFEMSNPSAFFIALSHHFIPFSTISKDNVFTSIIRTGSHPLYDGSLMSNLFGDKTTPGVYSQLFPLISEYNFLIVSKLSEWTLMPFTLKKNNPHASFLNYVLSKIHLKDIFADSEYRKKVTAYLNIFEYLVTGTTTDEPFDNLEVWNTFERYLQAIHGFKYNKNFRVILLSALKGEQKPPTTQKQNSQALTPITYEGILKKIGIINEEDSEGNDDYTSILDLDHSTVSGKEPLKLTSDIIDNLLREEINGKPWFDLFSKKITHSKYLKIKFGNSAIQQFFDEADLKKDQKKLKLMSDNIFFRLDSHTSVTVDGVPTVPWKITIYPLLENFENIPDDLMAKLFSKDQKNYFLFIVHYVPNYISKEFEKTNVTKLVKARQDSNAKAKDTYYLIGFITDRNNKIQPIFLDLSNNKAKLFDNFNIFSITYNRTVNDGKEIFENPLTIPLNFSIKFEEAIRGMISKSTSDAQKKYITLLGNIFPFSLKTFRMLDKYYKQNYGDLRNEFYQNLDRLCDNIIKIKKICFEKTTPNVEQSHGKYKYHTDRDASGIFGWRSTWAGNFIDLDKIINPQATSPTNFLHLMKNLYTDTAMFTKLDTDQKKIEEKYKLKTLLTYFLITKLDCDLLTNLKKQNDIIITRDYISVGKHYQRDEQVRFYGKTINELPYPLNLYRNELIDKVEKTGLDTQKSEMKNALQFFLEFLEYIIDIQELLISCKQFIKNYDFLESFLRAELQKDTSINADLKKMITDSISEPKTTKGGNKLKKTKTKPKNRKLTFKNRIPRR